MSQGNFAFLPTVEDPHTITNYWKRLLREMKEPLIPFDLYGNFEQIGELTRSAMSNKSQEERKTDSQFEHLMLLNIKFLLNQLPDLNFNTLKFHVEFFAEVAQQEPYNKMSAYNVAVTVGPNIFRPKFHSKDEILNVGIFYDLLITMIEKRAVLFDKNLAYIDLLKKWGTKVPRSLSRSLSMTGDGIGLSQGEQLSKVLRLKSKRLQDGIYEDDLQLEVNDEDNDEAIEITEKTVD